MVKPGLFNGRNVVILVVTWIILASFMGLKYFYNSDDDISSEDTFVFPDDWCGTPSAMKQYLNISAKGYDHLKLGPIKHNNGTPVCGPSLVFIIHNHNVSTVTNDEGYAIFNFTFPVQYGQYRLIIGDDESTENWIWLEVRD